MSDTQDLKRLSGDAISIKLDLNKLLFRLTTLQGEVLKIGLEQTNGYFERASKYMGLVPPELQQVSDILDSLLEKKGD
jgi:hypothetical protein